jgi:sulfite reductase alpha subunit-like flavoprotein
MMGGEKKRMMAVVVATAMAASCEAFVSPVVSSPKWSIYRYTQLWGSLPGGGVAVVPAGNLSLFDPEQEGKLQGSGQLQERIQQGASYLSAAAAGSASSVTGSTSTASVEAQHFLEDLGVPVNFAKPNNPATATILGRARIITDDAPGDIQHIVMKLPEGMHYVEGQSLSVIPPGVDAKTGRNFAPRLYSIASTRYGDVLDGTTISLCVRRAEYYDDVTGQVDPTKAGACSKFLCDAMPGTTVSVAGPVGKTMLLPENPSTDVIMIATGTGVAPFRGFMHRLFMEQTVARHMFDATAWLVLGVPTTGGLLYKDEFDAMLQNGTNHII